jgi:hypothetical protein
MAPPMHYSSTELLSGETAPQKHMTSDGMFALQSDATLSDQVSKLSIATSTTLSEATPRTSHLLPYESANLTSTAVAPAITDAIKLPHSTADTKQLTDPTEDIINNEQSSQLDSMLLSKVPRELRDKIYRHAVVENSAITIAVTRSKVSGEKRGRLHIEHPLMAACKQTHREVAKIYYLENTFRITDALLEPRAISELNRLLRLWAHKIVNLEISHVFERPERLYPILTDPGITAHVGFSICTSQGRILVKPMQPTVQFSRSYRDRTRSESEKPKNERMCYCAILYLAAEHKNGDVLSGVQKYADWVVERAGAKRNLLPFCWNCAGFIIV